MENILLPEIGNWKKKNNIIYHTFKYNTIKELNVIYNILSKFVENHKNYFICLLGEDKLKIWKEV